MSEDISLMDVVGARTCNTISLLVPAYQYKIKCAWTKEASLPAVEEFTCRLLLAMQELLPGEIQKYFGLNKRECEVLVETLVRNKLAVYTNDGHLAPSTMLIDHTKGDSSVAPNLTKYEDQIEQPVFELLTRSIMPHTNYNRSRYGLPEIPVPLENKAWSSQDVAEAFGRQYRAYLDFSRIHENEAARMRLYKVGTCQQDRAIQIPVDMNIDLVPHQSGAVHMHRSLTERQGSTRHRPLTMEMEAKISDFLGQLRINQSGISLHEYCKIFRDDVLERYVDDRGLDINVWLLDHSDRKTGYGSQLTRAMIGPVYLQNNRLTIQQTLEQLAKDWDEAAVHTAIWLSSSVPLWAASGNALHEFCRKISESLTQAPGRRGPVTAIFPSDDPRQDNALYRRYHNRIPNGITYKGDSLQDRLEILLIPGQLAVVQFHDQPSRDSAITVPIGYMTHDPERLAVIEGYLYQRLSGRGEPSIAWSEDENTTVAKLLGADRLEKPEDGSTRQRLSLKRPQ